MDRFEFTSGSEVLTVRVHGDGSCSFHSRTLDGGFVHGNGEPVAAKLTYAQLCEIANVASSHEAHHVAG